MKISRAIFDMDGTLLDSMYVWENIDEQYLEHCGVVPQPDLAEKVKSMSMEQVSIYIAEYYGIKKAPSVISDEINALIELQYREKVMPKPGVMELVQGLHARGVKMCVATATDLHLVEMALVRTGLRPFFQEIFTCTNVGAGKEKPLIFEKALELLGTAREETPVFEDSLYAIKTAKAAGLPIVAIYDRAWDAEWTEICAMADVCIDDTGAQLSRLL